VLIDMHAHTIPGALHAVGKHDHKGPRVGPCDDEHARLLETDRMQFKAVDAFYSAQRRLEEMERSGVDAEVVSPMPPPLDYGLIGEEGLELARRVNEFIAELTRIDPNRLLGMAMLPLQAPELAAAELAAVEDMGLVAVEIAVGSSFGRFGDIGHQATCGTTSLPISRMWSRSSMSKMCR
jgi:aminocarboxymuconate-semialdehyde decarboxylase